MVVIMKKQKKVEKFEDMGLSQGSFVSFPEERVKEVFFWV